MFIQIVVWTFRKIVRGFAPAPLFAPTDATPAGRGAKLARI